MSGQSMDAVYRYQRHIYDATRKFFLFGRDQLIADLQVTEGGTILEIGCGTGRNLIKIARAYPSARLFGLDISTEMLATARASVSRAGLTDRITFVQGDATNFDADALFSLRCFDRVVMSYTLSMIPDWQAALAQGMRVLAPAGTLHLVDFGQQEGLPRWFKRLLFAWLESFGVHPRADLPTVLTKSTQPYTFTALYRGYAWAAALQN